MNAPNGADPADTLRGSANPGYFAATTVLLLL